LGWKSCRRRDLSVNEREEIYSAILDYFAPRCGDCRGCLASTANQPGWQFGFQLPDIFPLKGRLKVEQTTTTFHAAMFITHSKASTRD
jgi:hypothetical protein